MKYFLASFLICTSVLAAQDEPPGGYNLGTIEYWSDWYPVNAEIDSGQICLEVRDAYNDLNYVRGYWGRLVTPAPVNMTLRKLADGQTQKRFFCHLRVKKFEP